MRPLVAIWGVWCQWNRKLHFRHLAESQKRPQRLSHQTDVLRSLIFLVIHKHRNTWSVFSIMLMRTTFVPDQFEGF